MRPLALFRSQRFSNAVPIEDGLNEGKSEDLLSKNSLYGYYVDKEMIKPDQANGGRHTILKGGLVYDTRDNEPNPFTGIWSEMQLHVAPAFLSNTEYGYARIILTPAAAKGLHRTLGQNLERFEEQHGEIRLHPGAAADSSQIGFQTG